ncbi:hypothetical protein AB0N62_34755 [Streptomyces sp. NPDC093982]|uniref:hypothetical protein n=1 Tax=Streptomyces sp. NPDC093982 TaxID=3155077 RepID=UPI00344832F6
MRGVSFMDSAGISILLIARRALSEADGWLRAWPDRPCDGHPADSRRQHPQQLPRNPPSGPERLTSLKEN